MTSYPCLADSQTVELRIENSALVADLRLSVALGNTLSVGPSGLEIDGNLSVLPGARISGVAQTINTGANRVVMLNTSWSYPPSFTALGSSVLEFPVSGLYRIGGCLVLPEPPLTRGWGIQLSWSGSNSGGLWAAQTANVASGFTDTSNIISVEFEQVFAALDVMTMECNNPTGSAVTSLLAGEMGAEMWAQCLRKL